MSFGLRWRCARCGSDQHGSHRYCSNCGRPAPVWHRHNAATGCAGCLGLLLILTLASGIAFSGCMAGCLYMVARPSSYNAIVNDVSWQRTTEIERKDLRSKEGPKDAIPAGAVDVKRKGRTNIFTYKVREWGVDRTLRAGGKAHIDIHWPVDTSATKGLERDPYERQTNREQYFVSMRYADYQIVRFPVADEATFRKFRKGSSHVITPMHGYVMIDGERYDH